jgi:WbqC-like protein family.
MILLIDSQYFSPSILYKISIDFSNIKIDIYEPWRKMGFGNRCVVAGANGPIILSVPLLEGRDQKKPVKEVRIDNRKPWQSQHWKTITSCYNRSPWFHFYSDELAGLYRRHFEFLIDWNKACFDWMAAKIGLSATSSFLEKMLRPEKASGYQDWRNRLRPNTINQQFPVPVRYRQVFEERTGYIPHLSVLDLLFCEGKNARRILSEN